MPDQTTLVAVFGTDAEARSAAEDAENSGIAPSDIHIHSEAGASGTSTGAEPHREGFMGWLKSLFGDNDREYERYQTAYGSGRTVVAIDTSEDDIEAIADLLDRHHPLSISEEPAGSGAAAPKAASAGAGGRAPGRENEAGSVPVVQEDIAVGKRTFVRGGVRVYSRVVEEPVSENVRLRDEQVYVERKPADRPVRPEDVRTGGDQVIEVQEYAEEPVVEKRSRVVEDVHVGKNVNERTETVQDKVRHTEVDVRPLGEQGAAGSSPGSIDESDYRKHFQQNYGQTGGSYDTYAPAYQYGESLARDPRFKGRKFNDIEPDLRSDYQSKYPGGSWERMKDSVRYGWDRVTGKG